jgi:hypothetical protein
MNTLKEIDHLENLAVDGRILNWIVKKYGVTMWIGFIGLRL